MVREEAGMLVRRLLLGTVLLGIGGTIAELYLLEHYEKGWQLVPIVALGAALLLTLAVLLRPARLMVRTLQGLLLTFLVIGALGIWRHYVGNTEFELERHPDMDGLDLLWATLRGATPALAPGTMVQIGLFGLIALWRHPAASGARAGRE